MNTHEDSSRPPRRRQTVVGAALLFALLALCGVGLVSGTAQSSGQEREMEYRIPSHLPIRVKLKNPENLKDLKNEELLGDLEVEVTNTGTKPIYYLYIALVLPDVTTEDGVNIAYSLRYGRVQLYEPREPGRPDDVPLLPGESAALKLPADRVSAWKEFRNRGKLSNPKKLSFWFQTINFGDGTGFWTPDGRPFPNVRS